MQGIEDWRKVAENCPEIQHRNRENNDEHSGKQDTHGTKPWPFSRLNSTSKLHGAKLGHKPHNVVDSRYLQYSAIFYASKNQQTSLGHHFAGLGCFRLQTRIEVPEFQVLGVIVDLRQTELLCCIHVTCQARSGTSCHVLKWMGDKRNLTRCMQKCAKVARLALKKAT